MGALQRDGQFSLEGDSVLSVLLRIGVAKASGLLTIEWDKFKKQIGFKGGEIVLLKSNWPQESFANFLVKEGLPAGKVKEVFEDWEKQSPRPDINVWIVSKDLVGGARLSELHTRFFQFRAFNLIWHQQGKYQFQTLPENYDFGPQREALSMPLLKQIWSVIEHEPKDIFFQNYLRSVMDKNPVFHQADFPFEISGALLRKWKDLLSEKPKPENLLGTSLRLLAVAAMLQIVSWSSNRDSGQTMLGKAVVTQDELRSLESHYSKMKAHEILGVAYDAPIEKCKEIYHELILRYHPDRMPDPEMKRIGESVFSFINGAFTVMTDSEKRLDYQAGIELEKMGGVEALQKRVEAEMKIPQAQQSLKRRHFRQALEAFEEIQKYLPDDGEVLADKTYAEMMWIIETKQNLKLRLPKLKQSYDSALLLRPRYAAAHYYRGLLYRYDNQLEKALHDFDEAISIDPNLSEAQSEARLIRIRSGKQKA